MLSINDEFSINFEPIRFLVLEYKWQNMGFRAGSTQARQGRIEMVNLGMVGLGNM